MRITTYDLDEHKSCPIEDSLRRLAAIAKPLEAACWHKLLELVGHLQAGGPGHELWGQIILQEMLLSKPEALDPVRQREMKKFLDEWRALHPDPTSSGNELSREMRERFPRKPGVQVRVRADWRDYGPIREGIPEMHYRFQIKRPGRVVTEDARAADTGEAARVIYQAFGW